MTCNSVVVLGRAWFAYARNRSEVTGAGQSAIWCSEFGVNILAAPTSILRTAVLPAPTLAGQLQLWPKASRPQQTHMREKGQARQLLNGAMMQSSTETI